MNFIEVKPIGFNKKGKKFTRHLLKFMSLVDKRMFKPVIMIIPENTDDMFIDAEALQEYRKMRPIHEYFYGGLVLGFGINVFVFDLMSCEFMKKNKSVKH